MTENKIYCYVNSFFKWIFLERFAFNPIQDWRAKKDPPTSFSPVTYANAKIDSQNFLIFSFNPFDRLVSNFKFVPSTGFSGQILIKLML